MNMEMQIKLPTHRNHQRETKTKNSKDRKCLEQTTTGLQASQSNDWDSLYPVKKNTAQKKDLESYKPNLRKAHALRV